MMLKVFILQNHLSPRMLLFHLSIIARLHQSLSMHSAEILFHASATSSSKLLHRHQVITPTLIQLQDHSQRQRGRLVTSVFVPTVLRPHASYI